MKLSANLTWLFNEYPFMQRFQAAAEQGFHAAEILFPYEQPIAALHQALTQNHLALALINAPAGDFSDGERGFAAMADKEAEFNASLRLAKDYATALQCPRIHVMAGLRDETICGQEQQQIYIQRLRTAADYFLPFGIDVLIEPLNSTDMPGYFLNSFTQALDIIQHCARPNLKLQFDVYHCQLIHHSVEDLLSASAPYIGHIQIASVPGRHEPNYGDLNYQHIFSILASTGYAQFIGCEYQPLHQTADGLIWRTTLAKEMPWTLR